MRIVSAFFSLPPVACAIDTDDDGDRDDNALHRLEEHAFAAGMPAYRVACLGLAAQHTLVTYVVGAGFRKRLVAVPVASMLAFIARSARMAAMALVGHPAASRPPPTTSRSTSPPPPPQQLAARIGTKRSRRLAARAARLGGGGCGAVPTAFDGGSSSGEEPGGVTMSGVCMDTVSEAAAERCSLDHAFCLTCVVSAIELLLWRPQDRTGAHDPYACLAGSACCKGVFTKAVVDELLPPVTALKAGMYLASVSLETCAELCGRCCAGGVTTEDGIIAQCGTCGASTCVRCKLAAHYGTPCSVGFGGASGGGADSVITPHELLSEAKIIACPTCNVAVTKQKGCNHITCTQRVPGTTLACDTDFCFSCGMRIMDVASHYTLSGCKRRDRDEPHAGAHHCRAGDWEGARQWAPRGSSRRRRGAGPAWLCAVCTACV